MAVVAGVVALGTVAAATGAAAAAGSYGIYKYFKRRTRQRRQPSHDEEKGLDFGQELEVYKVTETKIPPPVAPKPKREGRRATVVVVTKQPSLAPTSQDAGGSSLTTTQLVSRNEPFITRLCPNAVKVLPDLPNPHTAAAGPRMALKSRSHDHRQKDNDSQSQSNDVMAMKTLQHKLEEERV